MPQSPIITAALMATYPSCEIGAYYAIMRSARILDDLEGIGVPGISVGLFASRRSVRLGHGDRVARSSNMPDMSAQVLALRRNVRRRAYYTKWIIAVDEDVDPTDFDQVIWALSTRCNPSDDLDILRNTWSTGLDPEPISA